MKNNNEKNLNIRKHLFSILLLCMIVLCGCSSNETIVGAWVAKDGGSLIGVDIDQPTSYDVYYVFNEDGTGKMLNVFPDGYNEWQQNVDLTYTVDENNTITMKIGTKPSKGTYKLDGDTLTLDTQRTGSFSMCRVDIEDVPSLPDAPFNLICGTDPINEYSGKIGEWIIVDVDNIPTGMTVEWQTDNPEVAAIEPSRLGTQCIIFIEGAGNATVTATRGDETRIVEVIGIETPNQETSGNGDIEDIIGTWSNNVVVDTPDDKWSGKLEYVFDHTTGAEKRTLDDGSVLTFSFTYSFLNTDLRLEYDNGEIKVFEYDVQKDSLLLKSKENDYESYLLYRHDLAEHSAKSD